MPNLTLDTYLDLCTQVYDLSKPTPPQDAYELYRSYAVSANGPILEPMCGTGRFLLPLVAEGFNVHGFDASKQMLDVLHKKSQVQNIAINVQHGFIEDITLSEKYQLIFIPSGSFGLLTDLQNAKNALKKLFNQLNDGGLLVFEAETLQSVPEQFGMWRGSYWTREDGKHILASFLDLPLQDSVGTTICRYELIDENSLINTEVEQLKVRLYELDVLCGILREVGFKEVKLIKAFDRNKHPEKNDELVVYECRK